MLYCVRRGPVPEGVQRPSAPIRFGVFDVDLHSGELRRQGVKVKLQQQPFQALVMLLERPGEVVTREELRKKLWPAQTFVDFDRGLNKAINRLREALGDDADNPRFIETLPQRGYRFIAPVEAQLDLRVQPSEGSGLATTSSARRWLLASAVMVLAIPLLTFGLLRDRLLPRTAPRIESVAVLPLQNLSAEPGQEYFTDGMTDELITQLAKIGSVRVISRTSSMQYKGVRRSLPAVARELNVDAIVEGTVLRSGERVRITAQLIRARDDRHLWAESFERDVHDVLTLQGEVAQAVARQIQVKLTAEQQTTLARARPVNPQAHEAYLKGNYFLRPDRLDKSIEFFNQAIALDPGYAQAYAGLSLANVYLGIFGLIPSGEAYPPAKVAAMKALELDETLAEAHNALADVKKGYDWDWAGAETEYKRALELNPSDALAHSWYADYLSKMRRHEEAVAEARRARELDPISASRTAVLGMFLYRAHRYDEAIETCYKALELDPNYPNAFWFLALAREQKRELPQAIAALEKAASTSNTPLFRALLGHAYALAGERAKALSALDELKALSRRRYVSPLDIALVHTGLGDRDSAFQWLEKAYQERTMRIQELPEPHFDSLRSDPRYKDLIRRIGLPL